MHHSQHDASQLLILPSPHSSQLQLRRSRCAFVVVVAIANEKTIEKRNKNIFIGLRSIFILFFLVFRLLYCLALTAINQQGNEYGLIIHQLKSGTKQLQLCYRCGRREWRKLLIYCRFALRFLRRSSIRNLRLFSGRRLHVDAICQLANRLLPSHPVRFLLLFVIRFDTKVNKMGNRQEVTRKAQSKHSLILYCDPYQLQIHLNHPMHCIG